MVNDINNVNAPLPGKLRNSGSDAVDNTLTRNSGKTDSSETVASGSSDTVQLSAQAQELSRIQSNLQALPEIDEARVAQIRESIASGSYVIDTDRIAAQILADEQSFNL